MTSSVLAWAGDVIISSPDSSLQVTVSDAGGRLYYSASLNGQQMLLPSALGLKTSIGDLTRELSIVNSQLSIVSNAYQMRGTKASSHTYKATKAVIDIENKDHQHFSIIFQVSDNDIAFRYAIPRQKWQGKEPKRLRIKSELSSFNFPDGTTTFISPQIGPESGWEQTKPSYEEGYSADAPMDTPSQYNHGYIFPALFHLGGGWALVSETGVSSGYCGSHLSDYQPDVGYTVSYPDAGENNGYGTDFAAIPLPGETPWRTITLGTSLKPIVETTISYDLVEPLYAPSTDYKPGRYTWSWLIWQ
ncbi:MAG: glycoside hydrolase family 97 N-terminal domain-containing protein, partial [Prevotella sp.]|nr:glycoside hydrolase family 97 N-terminal domain-containing protein [Prevotella sp.]